MTYSSKVYTVEVELGTLCYKGQNIGPNGVHYRGVPLYTDWPSSSSIVTHRNLLTVTLSSMILGLVMSGCETRTMNDCNLHVIVYCLC